MMANVDYGVIITATTKAPNGKRVDAIGTHVAEGHEIGTPHRLAVIVGIPPGRQYAVVHFGGIIHLAGDAISFGIIGVAGIDRSLP